MVQRYRQRQEICRLVVEVAPAEKKAAALQEYQDALAPHAARVRKEENERVHEMFSNMMRTGPFVIVPEETDGK